MNYDKMDAEELKDRVEYFGGDWAKITQTDPASVDEPSKVELDIVRDWLYRRTKKDVILAQARQRFPDQKLRLRSFGGEDELLVGPEGEHCYAVCELEHGTFDFEQRD